MKILDHIRSLQLTSIGQLPPRNRASDSQKLDTIVAWLSDQMLALLTWLSQNSASLSPKNVIPKSAFDIINVVAELVAAKRAH